MTESTQNRTYAQRIALAAGVLVMAVAVSVLIGWALDLPSLKTVFPGMVTMKANTAVGLLACSLSLVVLIASNDNRKLFPFVRFLALVVIGVGLITMAEQLFSLNLGIDHLLFPHAPDATDFSAVRTPGRMAPATAFCLLLAGCSIWASSWLTQRRGAMPFVEATAVAITIMGGFALAGYGLVAAFGFLWWSYTGMAIHSALAFVIFGAGLMAYARSRNGLHWFMGHYASTGFAAVILSLLAVAGVSYYFISQLRASAEEVAHTQEILKKIGTVLVDNSALGGAQRAYINTGSEEQLKLQADLKIELYDHLEDLRRSIQLEKNLQSGFQAMDEAVVKRVNWGDRYVALRRERGMAAAEQLMEGGDGVALSAAVRQSVKDLEQIEYSALGDRQRKEQTTSSTTFLLLPLGVFFSVSLLCMGLFSLNAEVRDRDEAERKALSLAAAASQLASIVEFSEDAIISKDLHGTVLSWNRGAQTLFGYSAEEMMGQSVSLLIPLNRQKEEAALLKSISEGRSLPPFDSERVRKDGSIVPVSITASPVRDAKENTTHVSIVARDITERRRAEMELRESHENLERNVAERTAQLKQAKERAEAAGRAKSEFMASMSHELRTPLNGIIGFSEFLVDGKPGPLNDKQKEYLNDVLTSGRHLLQLINDVLDLAKVEAGRIEFFPENFQLRKAIDEVKSVASPMAQKKRIDVKIDVTPEMNGVMLDQVKFKQVVYNLLSNALKFTDAGGKVEVTCKTKDPEHFFLAVRDTGIGIRPGDLGRLFKEFEQIDSGTGRRYEGTGLGLALTRKLVQMQGGGIDVQSDFGHGSTFTVTLPYTHQGEKS